MLSVKARTPNFSASNSGNIRKLRSLIEIGGGQIAKKSSRLSVFTHARKLGFAVPKLEKAELSDLPEAEALLPGRPLGEMLAALRSYEGAIRDELAPRRATRRVAISTEVRAARAERRNLKAEKRRIKDEQRQLRAERRKLVATQNGAEQAERKAGTQAETQKRSLKSACAPAEAYWKPAELKELCGKFLDTRIRTSDTGWDFRPTSSTEYKLHFSSPLPYDHPDLPDWQDGVLPNLAKRVIVIREVAARQVDLHHPSFRDSSSMRITFNPIACSSRIPEKMSVKELLQDYAYLRAYSRADRTIALTCETYLDGKPERSATRFLITCGGHRKTLRLVVRDRYWLDITSGRARAGSFGKVSSRLLAPVIPAPAAPARRVRSTAPAAPAPLAPSPTPQPAELSNLQTLVLDTPLKPREATCLELVVKGKTNLQIASVLNTSEQTVKNTLSRLYARMGACNRVQARSICLATDLLETRSLKKVSMVSLPLGKFLLRPRDKDILSLLIAGKKNQEIAHELGTTEQTIKNRLSRFYASVGVKNREGARCLCAASGLL